MAFYNDIANGVTISTEFFSGGKLVFLSGKKLQDPPEPLIYTRVAKLPTDNRIFAGIGNASDFVIVGNEFSYRKLDFKGAGNQPIGVIISPEGHFILAVSMGLMVRIVRVLPTLETVFVQDRPTPLTSQGIRDLSYFSGDGLDSDLIIHLTDDQRTININGIIYHLWMRRGDYTVGQVDNKGVWAFDHVQQKHYVVSPLETWTAPRIDISQPEPIVAIPSGNRLFVPFSWWLPVDEPQPEPQPVLRKPEVSVTKWDLNELKDGREFIFHDRENPELGYGARVYVENGSMHAEISNKVGSGRTGARREVKPCL